MNERQLREAKAEALREAATRLDTNTPPIMVNGWYVSPPSPKVIEWLRARADQIEEEGE